MVNTQRNTLLAALLVASGSTWAALPTELHPPQVVEGEAVQLIIELGEAPGGDNDLTPLEQDFNVLGRSQQASTVLRNGRLTRSKQLTLTLAPKRAGALTVPAFMLEGDLTVPQTLQVMKPSAEAQQALNENVRIQGTLSAPSAYVQQPLIYTLRIELAAQLFEGAIAAPEVAEGEAVIEPLGEQKQFRHQRGNRLIQVVEQQYLITPQRSGLLRLSAAELSGKLPQGRARDTVFGRQYSQFRQVAVRTDSHQIDVKPIPASFTGSDWLPAQNVTLTDDWQMEELTVGQPITRTLTLQVTGLGASQLPTLKMAVPPGVRQYPEEPVVDHALENGVLTSTLRQQVTLIPTVAGALAFPPVAVPWWKLETDQPAVAQIEGTGLQITGDPSASGLATPAVPVTPAAVAEPPTAVDSPAVEPPVATPVATGAVVLTPWLLGGGFAALLVAASLGWWFGRRSAAPQPSRPAVSGRRAPVMPDTSALRTACQQHDAAAARAALHAWCEQRWPGGSLKQLATLASPALKAELQALNRALYAQQASERWQGSTLWPLFAEFLAQHSRDASAATPLTALNPVQPA